jgi:hypothetical protein
MFLVLGNSIEDLKNGVEQIERAKASGYSCGAGGSSIEELEIVKELIEEGEVDIEDVVEKPLDVFKLVSEYFG